MRKIHRFQGNGKNIILDVASGSVHVVDDMIFDMAADMLDLSKEAIVEKYKARYDSDALSEGYDELDYLIEEGLLYAEDTPVDLSGFNPHCHIKAMCLHVSHDCNLRCAYCFASQGDFHGERMVMDLETGKKALDFLLENSGSRRNLEVDFFGGEPMMNFDVVKELVAYGREREKEYGKHFRFTMTTNGIL
ncbi:MAG: 4Fe-4S cluster-binding domain-containing protein, partial [Aedoeadaptatus pacaensis]